MKTRITKIGKDGGYSDVDNDGHDNTLYSSCWDDDNDDDTNNDDGNDDNDCNNEG